MAASRHPATAVLSAICGLLALAGMAVAAEPAKPPAAEDASSLATVTVPKAQELDAETRCLALAVYWEGRAEKRQGQVAIAHTVLNRVGHDEFPDTVCGVVAQKSDSGKSCQFSWWCDGKRDTPASDEQWEASVDVAREAKAGRTKDPTKGALFFHSAKINPKWGGKRQRIARIGDHVFYR